MRTWIALLRGVNVGGANKLPMAELRSTMRELGHERVATHIQSGNIVFDGDGDEPSITEGIRSAIEEHHGLDVPVVVRGPEELAAALERHPGTDQGVEPKLLHVAFLDREPTAASIGEVDPDRWLPDRWHLHGRELYLTYPRGSGRSKMTIDRFERPWSVIATARNLNTVTKLVELAGSTRSG